MMELFILRHGHAEPEAAKDSLRNLTARGRQEVEQVVRQNLDALRCVETLVVSPYVRAQQTAAIAATLLGGRPRIDSELFVPNGRPDACIAMLHEQQQAGVKALMVVGHQPLLGVLLEELCGAEPGKYRLGTASLAALDAEVVAAGLCDLRWLHHADV